MKLDRLLGIIIILLKRDKVQAKELADRFGVSTRTIYRDIDTISLAGIPVVTYNGSNGGISLAEGFRLSAGVLTDGDLADIVSGLKSLSTSVPGASDRLKTIIEKLSVSIPATRFESLQERWNHLIVDLSPWGGNLDARPVLAMTKQAIENNRVLSFVYHKPRGDKARRTVEPHTLVLKGERWYLYAFCKDRQSFRLFKLSRMSDIIQLDERFMRREVQPEEMPWDEEWYANSPLVEMELRFTPYMRSLVEERFGINNTVIDEAGYCIVQTSMPEDEWVYGFILSYGESVEVLSPSSIREGLRMRAMAVVKKYGCSHNIPDPI